MAGFVDPDEAPRSGAFVDPDARGTVSQTPAQQSPTLIDRAARAAGIVSRGLTTGLAYPSLAIGEAGNQLYNLGAKAVGADQRPSVMEGWNTFLNNAGLPEPANVPERISSAVAQGMGGVGGQMGMVRGAATAPGTASDLIRNTLLAQPGRQTAASALSGLASQSTAEMGGGPIAQTAAGMAGGMVPFARQSMGATLSPETQRTADTFQAGRNIGLVAPPSEANPGFVNNLLTGRVAGRAATEQAGTRQNQPMTNAAVKADLGIPENQAATVAGLRAIRQQAGGPYAQIAQQQYATDPQFLQDVAAASAGQRTLAAANAGLEDERILRVAHSLTNAQNYDGRTLVELNKSLRDRQVAAFRAGETGAGRAYSQLSNAVEDLIDRNLSANQPGLLNAYREARQLIAKTYSAEAALNDATGNFSGRILGNQFDSGQPVSGRMRTVGRFANAFPGAMQDDTSAAARQAGGSVLDTYGSMHGLGMLMGGAGGAGMTHNPAWLALAGMPLLRPAVRSGILSGAYQDAMVAPTQNPLTPQQAIPLGILNSLR